VRPRFYYSVRMASCSRQIPRKNRNPTRIGLISDTHGLLREEAVRALCGSDLIIHAGDVGGPGILEELGRIAPVVGVRGNVDTGTWASGLPETAVVEAGPVSLYVLHDLNALDLDAGTAGFQAVVSGHSHKGARVERDGVCYINPGSAGPRRFHLPVTVARLDLSKKPWMLEFVDLEAAQVSGWPATEAAEWRRRRKKK
jgi:uncharacterized protein